MIRRAPLVPVPPAPAVALLAVVTIVGIGLAIAVRAAPTAGDPVVPASLADRLGPQTWAFAIPQSWIAAPIDGLREGDVLDLIGTRPSERASALEVARGLRVMHVDERGLTVELTADDAAAIAEARARGLSFMPILRSTR